MSRLSTSKIIPVYVGHVCNASQHARLAHVICGALSIERLNFEAILRNYPVATSGELLKNKCFVRRLVRCAFGRSFVFAPLSTYRAVQSIDDGANGFAPKTDSAVLSVVSNNRVCLQLCPQRSSARLNFSERHRSIVARSVDCDADKRSSYSAVRSRVSANLSIAGNMNTNR